MTAPRSPNARPPVKLPALAAVRASSSLAELARAVEALREWVEVRLGSRGDAYERAVTLRELDQRLKSITDALAKLDGFNGKTSSLRADPVTALPTAVRVGAMEFLSDGSVWVGTVDGWRKLTLAPP